MGETSDNTIIKLRLTTFIAIIVAVVSITFSVAGFIFSTQAIDKELERLDKRITKTTGRNAESIKELEKKHSKE